MTIPVITIDGPSGSGKGTIAQLLAKKLGWHFLDSGALYRAIAWAVLHEKIDPANLGEIEKLLSALSIEMQIPEMGGDAIILCNQQDITDEIRTEACGQMASIISAIPLVRAALLDRQRAMRKAPGLVTDGRDMGTVVFPDANLKFYLTASLEERALRRFNQLKNRGKHVSLRDVQEELHVRDQRDANRAIAPSKPAPDVVLIDTTHLGVADVMRLVLQQASIFP